MKLAVIGSRNLTVGDLSEYIPSDVCEIVTGGAKGIDACAADYAREHGLRLTEFLPNYPLYKRGAPLKRNEQIVAYADAVLAFWDGRSRGTHFVIEHCKEKHKPCKVICLTPDENSG